MPPDFKASFATPIPMLDLVMRDPDGTESAEWIGISAPRQAEHGDWECLFVCSWVHADRRAIPACGVDPLNALDGALRAVEGMVSMYRDLGRRFFYQDGEEYGVPYEPTPEQAAVLEAGAKLQHDMFTALRAGASKEDIQQMVEQFKRDRGMAND